MTSSTNTFLGYIYAKNRYINLEFGIVYAQAWFYNILYGFSKLKQWVLTESYIENQFFFIFGSAKSFLRKSKIVMLKIFYSTPFDALYLHFARNFLFLVIFQTFINFRPKMA